MSGATRVTQDFAGGKLLTGSENVFVNGMGSVRVGDLVAPHGKGKHSNSRMASGSSTVFINGISACRQGDVSTCAHKATGADNVFIGG